MPENYGTSLQIFDLQSETIRTVTLPNFKNCYTSQIWNGKLYILLSPHNTVEIFTFQSDLLSNIQYLLEIVNELQKR